MLPSVPEYWRATHGEDGPSYLNPVSSMRGLHRPGRGRHELLQRLMVHPKAFGHWLHRLPPAIEHQAPKIQAALGPLIPPRQRRENLRDIILHLAPNGRDLLIPHKPKLTNRAED